MKSVLSLASHEFVENSLSHWVRSPIVFGSLGVRKGKKGAVGFIQGWNSYEIHVTKRQESKGDQGCCKGVVKIMNHENKQGQKWRKENY